MTISRPFFLSLASQRYNVSNETSAFADPVVIGGAHRMWQVCHGLHGNSEITVPSTQKCFFRPTDLLISRNNANHNQTLKSRQIVHKATRKKTFYKRFYWALSVLRSENALLGMASTLTPIYSCMAWMLNISAVPTKFTTHPFTAPGFRNCWVLDYRNELVLCFSSLFWLFTRRCSPWSPVTNHS